MGKYENGKHTIRGEKIYETQPKHQEERKK